MATAVESVGSGRAEAPSSNQRIPALDVLRGIAILGTLASNIWIFTAGRGAVVGDDPGWLHSFSSWMPNGKFLGLLTIMFGIGLEIQRQSALRAGKKWPGKYPIRTLLLFADGVLNYIFVIQFDVLRAYAVVGVLVAFLLLTSERVQWWLIGLFFSAHFGLLAWMGFRTVPTDDRPPSDRALPEQFGEMAERAWLGDWWSESMTNLKTLGLSFGYGSEFVTILLMGSAAFLLGAKLYRIGIFGQSRRRLRYALIGIGFAVALPLDYLLANTTVFPAQFGSFARYGAALVVALGILALVGEFIGRRARIGLPGRLLSYVGRMALSCYLLQNILGVLAERLLFDRPFFGRLHPTLVTYAAFAAISIILIAFSWAWLRYFTRGPFELAWYWCYRKLARE